MTALLGVGRSGLFWIPMSLFYIVPIEQLIDMYRLNDRTKRICQLL